MPMFVQLLEFPSSYPFDWRKENRGINVVLANLQKKNVRIISVALSEMHWGGGAGFWVISYDAPEPIEI